MIPQSAMLCQARISSSPTITSALSWTSHIQSAQAVRQESSIRVNAGLSAAEAIPIQELDSVRLVILLAPQTVKRFKAVEWFEVLVAEKIIPATPKNVETRRLPTSFTTKVTRAFSLKCQRAWVVEPILESVGMLATIRQAIARRATALVESQVLAA